MAKRSISSDIWHDAWFDTLSGEDKLLWFYLLTNERTNMLGIYEIPMRKICFETNMSESRVRKGFEGFAKASKASYTDDGYVILRNFIKNQKYNPNMKKSAMAIYHDLPNSLKINDLEIEGLNPLEGFERVSEAFGNINYNYNINIKEKIKKKEILSEELPIQKIPFNDFYDLYPKKVEKQNALIKWQKLSLEDQQQAMEIIKIYPFTDEKQFIMNPAKWIHGRRWEDDLKSLESKGKHAGADRGLAVGQVVRSEGTKIQDESTYGF